MTSEGYKILVLGASGVGKTSVIMYSADGTKATGEGTSPTISYDVKEIDVEVKGKEKVLFKLWDTAGQERYTGALTSSFYRNTDGALLVGAKDDEESLEALINWSEQAVRFSMSSFPPEFVVLWNKSDLDSEGVVPFDVVKSTAQEKIECVAFETSAATGEGIMDALQYLAKKLANRTGGETLGDSGTTLNIGSGKDEKDSIAKRGRCII